MRKTKIIATLGPASEQRDVLKQLIAEGMNTVRLNFSHGTHQEHLKRINLIKELREEMAVPLAILLDTKGPEIRIGTFAEGSVQLRRGQDFTLTTRQVEGDEQMVSVTYQGLPGELRGGDCILIDDGLIELTVSACTDTDVHCVVQNSGRLSNRKSINLPGINLKMPYLTDRDRADIEFGIQQGVDFIATSFTRTGDDVRQVKKILRAHNSEDILIIAKIENHEGIENIDDILQECDGIMIARGDMGVEVPFEELPRLQKLLIKKCMAAGKIAITATQMLESMTKNPRPTRAEVSDVANAIYDGTSAIMLSGETAAGAYPVESVRAMAKIARHTESAIHYKERFKRASLGEITVTNAISHATCTTAADLDVTAIITVTQTGNTARMISKFRPYCPVISSTTSQKVYRQLGLIWGVCPVLDQPRQTAEDLFESAVNSAKSTGWVQPGDVVVITGGSVVGVSGTTNVLRVHTVE